MDEHLNTEFNKAWDNASKKKPKKTKPEISEETLNKIRELIPKGTVCFLAVKTGPAVSFIELNCGKGEAWDIASESARLLFKQIKKEYEIPS